MLNKVPQVWRKKNVKHMCYIWNKLATKSKELKKNKYDYTELKFGSEARDLISRGIIEMSNTVGKTYGPLGKNVAIQEHSDPVILTKDGVTVAKYIKFGSRRKNLGCRILSTSAGSTNVHAGDGTTTSTILAAEIVKLIKPYLGKEIT
jgi:chaperonin GroEL (HSP60 family)